MMIMSMNNDNNNDNNDNNDDNNDNKDNNAAQKDHHLNECLQSSLVRPFVIVFSRIISYSYLLAPSGALIAIPTY